MFSGIWGVKIDHQALLEPAPRQVSHPAWCWKEPGVVSSDVLQGCFQGVRLEYGNIQPVRVMVKTTRRSARYGF